MTTFHIQRIGNDTSPPAMNDLSQRLLAEALGTGILVVTVVGPGLKC